MDCGLIAGLPGITPRVGAAAMAMVTYKTEEQVAMMAFATGFSRLDISRCSRLPKVVEVMQRIKFGGTDCSLPMRWALKSRVEADAFVVYTDSETWAGPVHPVEALRDYRERMGIPAKLIVVGMVSNGFTIADPDDAGMLDVVGFDSAAPQVMSDFVSG